MTSEISFCRVSYQIINYLIMIIMNEALIGIFLSAPVNVFDSLWHQACLKTGLPCCLFILTISDLWSFQYSSFIKYVYSRMIVLLRNSWSVANELATRRVSRGMKIMPQHVRNTENQMLFVTIPSLAHIIVYSELLYFYFYLSFLILTSDNKDHHHFFLSYHHLVW